MIAEDMTEKKLRGSGGYAIARVTDEDQKKGNLGGPELFLAGIGRLEEDRFVKHYCNKCEKAYEGSPSLVFENPNEELGEGNAHITIQIGEKEVPWDGISKIGDIILLKAAETKPAAAAGGKFSACV